MEHVAVYKDAVSFVQQKFHTPDLRLYGAAADEQKLGFRVPVERKAASGKTEKVIDIILNGKFSFSVNSQLLKIISYRYA